MTRLLLPGDRLALLVELLLDSEPPEDDTAAPIPDECQAGGWHTFTTDSFLDRTTRGEVEVSACERCGELQPDPDELPRDTVVCQHFGCGFCSLDLALIRCPRDGEILGERRMTTAERQEHRDRWAASIPAEVSR